MLGKQRGALGDITFVGYSGINQITNLLADGVLRVAGTRVTLDSIVMAFDLGATPEEIVQR